MYRYTCDFCDDAVEADTIGDVQQRGQTHLAENHHGHFEFLFAQKFGGQECLNECGYHYPTTDTDVGFECPNCGHDNFPEFASRHVWWHVEAPDTAADSDISTDTEE